MPDKSHVLNRGSDRPPSRSGRSRARFLAVLTTLVLALSLAACSGDDGPSSGPKQSSDRSGTASSGLPQGLDRSVVRIGDVAGSLSRRDRKRLVDDVGGLVDRWFTRAWLDAPLGRKAKPYPGFTQAAQRRAKGDRHVVTARAVDRPLGGVVPRVRGVRLDVLAPGGTPHAVTARFHLGLAPFDKDLERLEGRIVVTGRLMLTRVGKRWRVFGYDVATSTPWKQQADKKQADKKQQAGKKSAKKQADKKRQTGKKQAKKKTGKHRKAARR